MRDRSHDRVPPHAAQTPRLTAHPPDPPRAGHPRPHGGGPLEFRYRRRTSDQRANRRGGVCPAVPQARPGALSGREPSRTRRPHATPQLTLAARLKVVAYRVIHIRTPREHGWPRARPLLASRPVDVADIARPGRRGG